MKKITPTSPHHRTMWLAIVALLGPWSCGGDRGQATAISDAATTAPAVNAWSTPAAQTSDAFAFTQHGGSWTAVNPAQAFSTTIDGKGATLTRLGSTGNARRDWALGLHVARVGRTPAAPEFEPSTPPTRAGTRVALSRGAGITEWFDHGARGLEHGIDIATKPAGDGDLVIEVTVAGLTPQLTNGGSSADLLDALGNKVLTYGQLAVKDAEDHPVVAHLTLEDGRIAIHVNDTAAKYPLVVDPLVWGIQESSLTAIDSSGTTFGNLGQSVAISGTTAVVGAPGKTINGNTRQGEVYVLALQSGSTWTVTQQLVSSDGAAGDNFGSSVSISGTTVIVGAYAKNSNRGAAYIFTKSGSSWAQQQELVASDGAANDYFGLSVSISGTTAIVGAAEKQIGSNTAQGAAYVFQQNGSSWTQTAQLVASDGAALDVFGSTVSISGTTALVAAHQKTIGSNAYQGAAYIFTQSGSSWVQQQELVAPDGAAGDHFGAGALSGTTAIIGASNKNSSQGAAYVFVQSGSTWTEQQELVSSDGAPGDNFGGSIAISGTSAFIGAFEKKVGANATQGAVYAFVQSGSSWTQQRELIGSDSAANDYFGQSVAVSGSAALVGAPVKSFGSAPQQGEAYLFIEGHANGDACSTGQLYCVSGYCVDGVCCNSGCGGGVATDCQACSVAAGGPTNGTCSASNVGVVCLAPTGICDNGATCNGSSLTCPADTLKPATTPCLAPVGPCDNGSFCTGNSPACPPPTFKPATTQCLAPLGPCDNGAFCTGSAAGCPADTFKPATTQCLAPLGPCDLGANCTGTSAACPTDTFKPATTQCLAPLGPCDLGANCTGTSAACPADTFKPVTTQCLAPLGPCDLGANCSGTSAACPADTFLPSTSICATASGCLAAAACTGSSSACPAPGPASDGTVCNDGVCMGGVCVPPADGGVVDSGADAMPDAASYPHDSGTPMTTPHDAAVRENDAADSDAGVGAESTGGCGCKVANRHGDADEGGLVALVLGLGTVVLRRRRRMAADEGVTRA